MTRNNKWTKTLVVSNPHLPYFTTALRSLSEAYFPGKNNDIKRIFLEVNDVQEWKENHPDRYQAVARSFTHAIIFPYDVSFIKFVELYAMGMPMWIPRAIHLYAFAWTQANPNSMGEGYGATKPFCSKPDLMHLHIFECYHLAQYSDFLRLPYLRYFTSLVDFLYQTEHITREDLLNTRDKMLQFHRETLTQTIIFWRDALHDLLPQSENVEDQGPDSATYNIPTYNSKESYLLQMVLQYHLFLV